MIASCGFLENELSQFSKEEGVTLADSVETLGVDLRTRVKRLGTKRKSEKKKVQMDVPRLPGRTQFSRKKLHEGGR